MTDSIPDLIAEARKLMADSEYGNRHDRSRMIESLAAALESLSAPPASDDYDAGYAEGYHHGLSAPRGSAEDDRNAVLPASDNEPQPSDGPDYHADHAFWAARQPASDDEREALADAVHDYRVGRDAVWTTHVDDEGLVHSEDHGFADAILAAGFRRLSPLAREALAKALHERFSNLSSTWDEYPRLQAVWYKEADAILSRLSVPEIYPYPIPTVGWHDSTPPKSRANRYPIKYLPEPAEVEWEYGVQWSDLDSPVAWPTRATCERSIRDHSSITRRAQLVQRTKDVPAGPWVPVEKGTEQL